MRGLVVNDGVHAPSLESDYLLERWGWLIRLRWIAVGGVLVTVVAAAFFRLIDQIGQLLLVTLGLGLGNAFVWSRWRHRLDTPTVAPLVPWIFWQLVGDVVALALLLHWSGGAENPFAMFFAFLMAIGAMLLPAAWPVYLGLVAAFVQGLVVLAEFIGMLAHHGLFLVYPGADQTAHLVLWRAPSFVLGFLLAFTLMLFGVVYFVRSVAERQRRADERHRERERVAVSRERLSRIGEIAAGVAHSVRNPLHGLINSVDLLMTRCRADPAMREDLSLMAEACRRIEEITRRLLVLTRDAPVCKKGIDLRRLVQDAVMMASLRARGSGARIETGLDPVGLLEVDPDRLTEALINLVDNALDACCAGGTVTVRTYTSGPRACIEVADTGHGISTKDLPRVFDPFFTTKAVGQGSGLGLPITRRVVEEHDGQVEIDSAPGNGTRVRLFIPLTAPPETNQEGQGVW